MYLWRVPFCGAANAVTVFVIIIIIVIIPVIVAYNFQLIQYYNIVTECII